MVGYEQCDTMSEQYDTYNFIMNIKDGERHWISKDKIYQPVNEGGLICIAQLYWIERYGEEGQDGYWTDNLYVSLCGMPAIRKVIIKWVSEQLSSAVNCCDSN